MIYRKNGKNGGDLSQLGFGCMRLPRRGLGIDIAKSAEIIHEAIEGGVNYFDTAYMYPGSEEAMGKILTGGWREKIKIIRKHLELMIFYKGERTALLEARKHLSWYIKGCKDSAAARDKINRSSDYAEMTGIAEAVIME